MKLSMLGQGTRDNPNLCSHTTVTYVWLQNKLSLTPFEQELCFFVSNINV